MVGESHLLQSEGGVIPLRRDHRSSKKPSELTHVGPTCPCKLLTSMNSWAIPGAPAKPLEPRGLSHATYPQATTHCSCLFQDPKTLNPKPIIPVCFRTSKPQTHYSCLFQDLKTPNPLFLFVSGPQNPKPQTHYSCLFQDPRNPPTHYSCGFQNP